MIQTLFLAKTVYDRLARKDALPRFVGDGVAAVQSALSRLDRDVLSAAGFSKEAVPRRARARAGLLDRWRWRGSVRGTPRPGGDQRGRRADRCDIVYRGPTPRRLCDRPRDRLSRVSRWAARLLGAAIMTIDAARLLAHRFDEVRQRYDARDAILYALGIGLGRDPLDARDLDHLLETRLSVLPAFVGTLASPGMWIRDPRLRRRFRQARPCRTGHRVPCPSAHRGDRGRDAADSGASRSWPPTGARFSSSSACCPTPRTARRSRQSGRRCSCAAMAASAANPLRSRHGPRRRSDRPTDGSRSRRRAAPRSSQTICPTMNLPLYSRSGAVKGYKAWIGIVGRACPFPDPDRDRSRVAPRHRLPIRTRWAAAPWPIGHRRKPRKS